VGEERGTLLEERRMRALRRSLDLTEEQSRQVREVFAKHREAHREAMEALFRDCGEPLAEVREAIDEEIGAILTPEQRTRYAELRTRHGRRFLGPRPHGRPHGPPGR
jgi:Spy/CpxP family protein refolding chaperone